MPNDKPHGAPDPNQQPTTNRGGVLSADWQCSASVGMASTVSCISVFYYRGIGPAGILAGMPAGPMPRRHALHLVLAMHYIFMRLVDHSVPQTGPQTDNACAHVVY